MNFLDSNCSIIHKSMFSEDKISGSTSDAARRNTKGIHHRYVGLPSDGCSTNFKLTLPFFNLQRMRPFSRCLENLNLDVIMQKWLQLLDPQMKVLSAPSKNTRFISESTHQIHWPSLGSRQMTVWSLALYRLWTIRTSYTMLGKTIVPCMLAAR